MGASKTHAPNSCRSYGTNCYRGCFSHYLSFNSLRGFTTSCCCPKIILGRSAQQDPILGFTAGVLYDSLRLLCHLDSISMEVCTTQKQNLISTAKFLAKMNSRRNFLWNCSVYFMVWAGLSHANGIHMDFINPNMVHNFWIKYDSIITTISTWIAWGFWPAQHDSNVRPTP